MKLSKYSIGDVVKITATLNSENEYKTSKNNISTKYKVLKKNTFPKYRYGWVTGISRRCEGYTIPGSWEEPSSFVPTKTRIVYLVRFGMLNKEHAVLEEDMTILVKSSALLSTPLQEFPYIWRDTDRALCRSEASKQERDNKGRFVKYCKKIV